MVCPGPTRQPTLSNGHVNGHRTATHLASPGQPCSPEEGSTDVSLVLDSLQRTAGQMNRAQFKYGNAALAFHHGWLLAKGDSRWHTLCITLYTGTRVYLLSLSWNQIIGN